MMSAAQQADSDQFMDKARSIAFILVGAGALMLKRHYAVSEVVWNYSGNVAASFAVYFLMTLLPFPARFRAVLAAGLALLVVETFEATDGFGVMSNTYDPVDFAANVLGVGLAVAVDAATRRITRRGPQGPESPPAGGGWRSA
jgi:hypothetical protein